MQPFWELHARHFAAVDADPAGPPEDRVAAARTLVDYRQVRVAPDRIAFERPGMAVTLNGIAQGYITDRLADRLRAAGLTHVLAEFGEVRALGPQGDGRPWRVGLEDLMERGRIAATMPIQDGAVATSGGYGTRFSPLCHHVFDPATGRSANGVVAVTMTAPTATLADALSTALAVLPPEHAQELLNRFPEAGARITIPPNNTVVYGGAMIDDRRAGP